jgi:hypothetical protein
MMRGRFNSCSRNCPAKTSLDWNSPHNLDNGEDAMSAGRVWSVISVFQKQLHEAFRRGSRRRRQVGRRVVGRGLELHEAFRRGSRRQQRRLTLTLERLERRIAPAVFVVTNTNDAGTGSFRQAILDSNASTAAANVIQFDIAGSGVETISLKSALPALTQAVTIEGNTQPGFNNSPLICLDGTSAGSSVGGLDVTAANCTVQWLIVEKFSGDGITITSANNLLAHDVVSGNQGNGITITGTSANSNTVEASLIGTNVAGTAALANLKDGIAVVNGSNNLVGTNTNSTDMTLGNDIAGNDGDGVAISGTSATSNQVSGNRIGTNAAGNSPLGNGGMQDPLGDYGNGIAIEYGAFNNQIGGPQGSGLGNLVSGNANNGIEVAKGATLNRIQGNFIGTDATGSYAVANGTADDTNPGSGVSIEGATLNLVGGNGCAGDGNVISGNKGNGVVLGLDTNYPQFGTAVGNVVQGNYIGTDVTGLVEVPNEGDGVLLERGANRNLIGPGVVPFGAVALVGLVDGTIGVVTFGPGFLGTGFDLLCQGNLISGNTGDGVHLDTGASFNAVYGNFIGVDLTGRTALPNGSNGVEIENGSNSNLIGAGGRGNVISGNKSAGVLIRPGTAAGAVAPGTTWSAATSSAPIPRGRWEFRTPGASSL